jgi:hypothetical protein
MAWRRQDGIVSGKQWWGVAHAISWRVDFVKILLHRMRVNIYVIENYFDYSPGINGTAIYEQGMNINSGMH